MKDVSRMKHIVIAGAGLMGVSLAQIFAGEGFQVTIYDIAESGIEKGKNLLDLNQKVAMEEKTMSGEESKQLKNRIEFTMKKDIFKEADFVIEAIVENLEVKQEFWKEVSKLVNEEIVLATNTSGLSITEIGKAVKKPERFAGMHWVNPPHLVPLVEVIKGDQTDLETLKIIEKTAQAVRKKPVLVKKDAPGFVLNRLQYALLREALYIVENGIADCEDVDNVMKYGLGMRYASIGPFETVDLGGLDTFFKVGSYLFRELSAEQEVPALLRQRYEEGAYGTKTGKGFYEYTEQEVSEVIEKRDRDFTKLGKLLFKDL